VVAALWGPLPALQLPEHPLRAHLPGQAIQPPVRPPVLLQELTDPQGGPGPLATHCWPAGFVFCSHRQAAALPGRTVELRLRLA